MEDMSTLSDPGHPHGVQAHWTGVLQTGQLLSTGLPGTQDSAAASPPSPQLTQASQFLLERGQQLVVELEARQEKEEWEAAEQEEGVEGAGEQQGQAGRQKSEPGYQVVLFQMRSGGWLTPDCQGYIEEL
jgi:hypothetical protein